MRMFTNKTLGRYVRVIIIIISSMSLDRRDKIIRYANSHTASRIGRTRLLSIGHINLIQAGSFPLLFSRQFTGQNAHHHRFTYSRACIYTRTSSFIALLFHPLHTYTHTHTHTHTPTDPHFVLRYIITLLSSHAEGTKNVKQTNRTHTGNDRDISQ
jgi:hypothetical protein